MMNNFAKSAQNSFNGTAKQEEGNSTLLLMPVEYFQSKRSSDPNIWRSSHK